MILRFNVVGTSISEEFELYSTQPELAVGFFDGLKTACLDLTVDAGLLKERNKGDIELFETAENPVVPELKAQLAKAETLSTGSVTLELSGERTDTKGKLRNVTVKALHFPAGALARLADIAVEHARQFQAAVEQECSFTEAGLDFLQELDMNGAYPLSWVKPAVVDYEEDVDDLLPVTPKARKKARKEKA